VGGPQQVGDVVHGRGGQAGEHLRLDLRKLRPNELRLVTPSRLSCR
jgi:hypothetical protein